MRGKQFVIQVISLFISLMLYYIIDANIYESISIYLFSYFLLNFVDSIGYDYNVNMITILFGIFQLLIMPMIVYRMYNNDSDAIALFYNMSVEQDAYYSFVIPGLLLMIIGMQMPLIRAATKKSFFNNSIIECKKYLKGKSNIGIVMMAIGLSSGVIEPFISAELSYIAYLLSKLLFVGIFYILFSEIKNKKIYVIIGLAALFIQTIIQGMFGELIYTSMLAFLLLLVGKKVDFYKKLSFCIVGAFIVLVLQSIKREYRATAWHGVKTENTSNASTFVTLLFSRLSNPGEIFDDANFFPIAVRFNQGMIQSKVMDYIPKYNPYTDGKTIFNSVIASFIPRFLWPDKPIAGGKWNMEYFTGLIIEGYSMNVGPLGEAYGNFGNKGGIYFMFFYGLFFNIVIYLLIRIAKTKPTIILWFPVLFLNSIQVETDILMTVNALLKNCIFVAVCYWAADRFMRIKL